MQSLADITAARLAIMDFIVGNAGELPVDVSAKIRELSASTSPFEQIVRIGELLYARRANINDAGRSLAASLISYATVFGWRASDRGNQIVMALRRDLGEAPPVGVTWPDTANDPAPLIEYVPPEGAVTALPTTITVAQYYALFTADEQAALNASDDQQIKDGIAALHVVSSVNLTDPAVTSGLDHMVALGLLTADRAARIKAGLPPA